MSESDESADTILIWWPSGNMSVWRIGGEASHVRYIADRLRPWVPRLRVINWERQWHNATRVEHA